MSVLSDSSGRASAYALAGDSTYSDYNFDVDGPITVKLFSVTFGTTGHLCKPAPFCIAWYASPHEPMVESGPRLNLANGLGNMIEAYPVDGTADASFYANVLYEKGRIEASVDNNGKTHYVAMGTNEWVREPLADSEFLLSPKTEGTGVTPSPAASRGNGTYKATMRLSRTPELNTIAFESRHYPLHIPYLQSGEVDPAYVDAATLTVQMIKDRSRPDVSGGVFSVWGIKPAILSVDPAPVLVDRAESVAQQSRVFHRVDPPEYELLLQDQQLWLEVTQGAKTALAADGVSGPFAIPEGIRLPSGDYNAVLSVLGVNLDAPIASAPYPVPACRLVSVPDPVVELSQTRDPLNNATCASDGHLTVILCRDARLTFTVDGSPGTARIDGSEPVAVTNVPLSRGSHTLTLSGGLLGPVAGGRAPFLVSAVDSSDPPVTDEAPGEVITSVRNRSVLPVGHTFVKGVDLLDGHLVQQATDLKLPGRHLGLESTRTYSSAGRSAAGVIGAGWSWNYASQLTDSMDSCGLVSVTTADGSSQIFRTGDGGLTFTPQKGYHTRLVRNADLSYDFFDKSGTRHHFREPLDPGSTSGNRRLEYIEEPHGDRLVLTYDERDRVARVAEVHPEAGEVRALEPTYVSVNGYERIAHLKVPGLGLQVDYDYDSVGNLRRATRTGQNIPGAGNDTPARVQAYDYTGPADRTDRYQLTAAIDPNGNRTEYHYFDPSALFPGESTGGGPIVVPDKWEYVKEVVEHPDLSNPSIAITTQFSYDYTESAALRFRTTVRDTRGNSTLYVLNGNGSPLRIEEPLGKTTVMEWSDTDIFKTKETDPLGRVTQYGYDDRGNLASERIATADFGVVETIYEYDPRFNKLTLKRDAEGRETRYIIDASTGDLSQATDAVGNVTQYEYDGHGRLQRVVDPRGNPTLHRDHDSFGNARTVTDAVGNVSTREYDLRGRLTRQADTLGRESRTTYDGLDRAIEERRVAGGSSDDDVTATEYYPGGEVRAVTNANGARTEYTLDGLNRVAGTKTSLVGETLTTTAEYDGNGNKVRETDRRGITRRNTYDALNRLRRVEIVTGLNGEGPLGQIAAFDYDLVGNKKSETNVAGLTTTFTLDGLYHVMERILPEGPLPGQSYKETFAYDRVGNRRVARDTNNQPTSYDYDGLDRVIRVTNALGHVTTTAFDDPEGSHVNRSEEHDEVHGLRTTYLYDALNRETERTVFLEGAGSAGEVYTTTTAYDDTAHAMTVTDPRGTQTRSALNGHDRVVEQVVDVGGLALTTRTEYDGLGNRKQLRDPNGNVTRFENDGLGRLVKTTDAALKETTYTYDGEGLKITETDRRGVVKHFTYDNLGRPRVASVDTTLSAVLWSHGTRYEDVARKRIEIDARGYQTVSMLDGLDRVVTVTDARGKTAVTKWDGVNNREETDRRGNTTKYDYDPINRLTRTTDPIPFASQTHVTDYDDARNKRTETDRRGIVKVTQTDPLGRVLSITRAPGTPDEAILERNVYDGNGNKTSAKDAEGKETRFAYDRANRLEARTDGYGTPTAATTTFGYDGNGNPTSELDPRAADLGDDFSVKRTYDALNRLKTVEDGEGDVTAYDYDAEGNKTLVREPEGQETTYTYDELGKLLTVTQARVPAGVPVTRYAYDPNRNRVKQTDANGHVVEMGYDELNRLHVLTQDPGGFGFVTQHDYDENGNEWLLTDAKGQKVTNTYDELNRLKTKTYAFAAGDTYRPWRHTTGVVYDYDANNNLSLAEESVASGTDPPYTTLKTVRTYDLLDRLSSETTSLPDPASDPSQDNGERQVTYTYYANGTRKTVGPGDTTTYTYDGQNRLETAATSAGTTIYTYWPDDLLRTVTYPNGVTATHGYDKADRLTSLVNAKDTAVVSSYGYTYDRNGNRKTQTEVNGGTTEATGYGYDALDRLETVTYPADGSYPNGRVVTYGYDLVGNRIRETEKDPGGVALADKQGIFDSLNRLTTLDDLRVPSNSMAFTWDNNGNQLTKTVGSGPGSVTTEYRYDVRDKLVEVQQGDVFPGRYQYDFEGRRSKKIGEEGVRQYVYDQTSLLREYDGSGLLAAKYDYGSDRLISQTRREEGAPRYFSFDGLRSVTNLTNTAGSAVASYHLDAWGNYRFPTELDSSRNRFGLTGHLFDRETGLYFAKARYLSPQLGRFLTQDSFLGNLDNPPSLHRYFYANGNPTRFVDPTGHSWEDVREWFSDAGTAFTEAVKGAAEPAGAFFANWSAGLAYRFSGNERLRAGAEAFTETAEHVERSLRSPEHLLSAVGEGVVETKQRYDEAFERGDIRGAARAWGNVAVQVPLATEAAGAFRATPGPALVTTEGVVLQETGVLVRAGGTGQAGILTAAIANEGAEARTVKENTPNKEDQSPSKAVKATEAPAAESPVDPASPTKGTGNPTIGTGVTPGGMSRTTGSWRQRYGPAAVREHHLAPQALLKDSRFTERLAELGVEDAKAFIDRKVARIPRALHDKVHAESWNQSWKDWLDAHPRFTLKDIEVQIKTLMKEHKVPGSTRNFAKPYGTN